MAAALILLLLVGAMIAGIALWFRRSRPETRPQAVVEAESETAPRRISLLTEAIGYIGTILVLAGAASAVGQKWENFSTTWRLVTLAAVTLLFLGVGWAVRESTEPAFMRLTAVTWAVSTAAFAGSMAVVTQFYDPSPEDTFVTIATTTTAYAATLWWLHREAIQQAVVFAGVLLSTAAVLQWAIADLSNWMQAVPLWAIGVAWAAGGWWRRIPPWFVAVPLGLLVALVAPAFITEFSGLRFGLGILTASTVMGLGVLWRFSPGLAMGAVAELGYVIGAVTYYFGDTLGVPASLAIAGALILTLAAVATHWHWFGRTQPPAQGPPSAGGETTTKPAERHHAA